MCDVTRKESLKWSLKEETLEYNKVVENVCTVINKLY